MILLMLKAVKLVLHHRVGKMYANFRTSLVSTAIRAVQFNLFKLFFATESIGLQNIAKVCEGMKSKDLWQEEAKDLKDRSSVVQCSSQVTIF